MPPLGSHSHGRKGHHLPPDNKPLGPYRREDYRPQEFQPQHQPEEYHREPLGELRQRAWAAGPPEQNIIQPLEVIDLHPSNFNNVVLDPARTVVVAFYAPWCKAPEMERLLHELQNDLAGESNIVLGRVDADMYKDLFSHFDPTTLPAILIFPLNNKHGIEYTGPRNKAALLEFIIYQHRGEVVHVPASGSRARGPPPPTGPAFSGSGPHAGYIPPAPPIPGPGPYSGYIPPAPPVPAPPQQYDAMGPRPYGPYSPAPPVVPPPRFEGKVYPLGTYSQILSGGSVSGTRFAAVDDFHPIVPEPLYSDPFAAPVRTSALVRRPTTSYRTEVVPYTPPLTSALIPSGGSYARQLTSYAGPVATTSYTSAYAPAAFSSYEDPVTFGTSSLIRPYPTPITSTTAGLQLPYGAPF